MVKLYVLTLKIVQLDGLLFVLLQPISAISICTTLDANVELFKKANVYEVVQP